MRAVLFWWTHRDWLGLCPAPHSLALELRFARSRLLIVEPATALQRDSRPAVRQNKKTTVGGLFILVDAQGLEPWTH